jgi:DNA-binding transcriptional regulator YiaG
MARNSTARNGAPRRQPAWSLVTLEAIESWRLAAALPKNRAAEHLGVTNSTYHNWIRGRSVPPLPTQRHIQRLIASAGAGTGNGAGSALAFSDAVSLEATSAIVSAYLTSARAKVDAADLAGLVRAVHQAVRGR